MPALFYGFLQTGRSPDALPPGTAAAEAPTPRLRKRLENGLFFPGRMSQPPALSRFFIARTRSISVRLTTGFEKPSVTSRGSAATVDEQEE